MDRNLIGQKFGRLTVIEKADDYVSPKGQRQRRWICECDCEKHTIKAYNENNIIRGKSLSCGCLSKEATSKMCLKDLTGKKFGRLKVVSRADNHIRDDGKKDVMWNCDCECGNSITVLSESLNTGHTQSCGCLSSELKSIRNKTPNIGESFLENDKYNRIKYWDYYKNDKHPSEVKKCSNDKFWFICPIHGSFKIKLNDINKGSWCGQCSKEKFDSQLAIIVSSVSKELYPNEVTLEYRGGFIKKKKESPLDLLIENKKYAIEFQSKYHDKEKPKVVNNEFIFTYKDCDYKKQKYYENLGYKYFMFDCREYRYNEIEVLKILLPEIEESMLIERAKNINVNEYQRIQWDIEKAQKLLDTTIINYEEIGVVLNTTGSAINNAVQRGILKLNENRLHINDWYIKDAQILLDNTKLTYKEIAERIGVNEHNIADAVYHKRLSLPQFRKKKELNVIKAQYLLDNTKLTYKQIAIECDSTEDVIKHSIRNSILTKRNKIIS